MFMPFCCYNSWLFYSFPHESEFLFSCHLVSPFFFSFPFSFLYLAPLWLVKET